MTPGATNLLGNSMAEHKFHVRVTCLITWDKAHINKEWHKQKGSRVHSSNFAP
jgi:hypothetical protein